MQLVTQETQNPAANAEAFYQTLITRNHMLIDGALQSKLRKRRFLVAGCGSIGGAIVEPLVRVGAENIVIAEPDGFDFSNLNRQQARICDVGVNKGVAVREQVRAISPYARIDVLDRGLTEENIDQALDQVAVVFDGVDVTGIVPLRIKFLMHQRAKERGIPVISGYDIAGLQLCVVYRYDDARTQVLHGKVKPSDFEGKEFRPVDFLFKVIPLKYIPYEIFRAAKEMLKGGNFGFPQVVYTARSFGNMALVAALEILEGRPTRKYVSYDHNDAVRPFVEKVKFAFKRWFGMAELLSIYFKGRTS